MASSQGRNRRHAHKKKRSIPDGFTGYMARKVCAICGKQCYLTRDEAKHSARVNHPGTPMHVYTCEEENGTVWWHLSSIPADKLKTLRDREHREY